MWLVKFAITALILFCVFLGSGLLAQFVFAVTHCLWTSTTVFSVFMLWGVASMWFGGSQF